MYKLQIRSKLQNLTKRDFIKIGAVVLALVLFILPIATKNRVQIHKNYYTKQDVALYIFSYNQLPKNFVTKDYSENIQEIISKGYNFGGDIFRYEGIITQHTKQTNLKEADIYSNRNGERGAERLVFTTNTKKVEIFYTNDHYETFSKITLWRLQAVSNVFWIIFWVYIIVVIFLWVNNIKKVFRKIFSETRQRQTEFEIGGEE